MPLTVTVTDDAFPKDHEFGVRGLGVFVNGKPTEISEEQERAFITENRMTVKDALKDSESITVEGTTEVNGGVKGVLGIDPDEISDTIDLDTMRMQEETGTADPDSGEELEAPTVIVVDPPKDAPTGPTGGNK